jgi:FixJ family two-component response regulator
MDERDRPAVSVVDDDDSLRRSLGNLLRSVGFGVQTFASAEEFLRSLSDRTPVAWYSICG